MNYKISLAALAVAATVSGQAMAASGDATTTVNALIALGGTITPTGYAGLDNDIANAGTTVWATVVDDTAACLLDGVLCAGGEITKLEIPNAGWAPTGGLPAVLAELELIKGTLINLNLSNTAATDNVLAGGFTGLDALTALEKLALNDTGATGAIPDMTDATSLNWINVSDNSGITGMGAKLAGGSAITLVQAKANPAMVGDMTATLASVNLPLATITLDNSKLYGTVVLAGGHSAALSDSDIIPTGDATAITNSGYDAATVVQPATGATATPGEESATINWLQPVTGEETGYSVSYSADNGVTLLGTSAVTGLTHSFSNVPAGTYIAVVQSTGPDSRLATPTLSADFDVTAAVITPTPLECTAPQILNEAETACVDPEEEEEEEETTSSGGGGAALWLVMLPLMGLLRRKRA